jgi:dihydrofolate reductase
MTRKIIVFDHVSADGYFASSDAKLDWTVPEKALDKAAAASLGGADAMLFGRKTYEMFASFWPHATDKSPHGPQQSPEIAAMARWINEATKIVFSTTLREATWRGSRIEHTLDRPTIEAITRAPGKDILVFGSGSVASRLTELGLVDEYHLVIAPILLGSGKPLVSGITQRTPLRLVEATPFPSGNVKLRYAR